MGQGQCLLAVRVGHCRSHFSGTRSHALWVQGGYCREAEAYGDRQNLTTASVVLDAPQPSRWVRLGNEFSEGTWAQRIPRWLRVRGSCWAHGRGTGPLREPVNERDALAIELMVRGWAKGIVSGCVDNVHRHHACPHLRVPFVSVPVPLLAQHSGMQGTGP